MPRREAITDTLTIEQYRRTLRTAARIDDRVKSITIFYLLTVMGRGGLRIGEAIHLTGDWLDEQRRMVVIPAHLDCECGLCRHYARQLVKNADENLTFETALDKYWSPKDESSRHVPIETERDWRAIRRYLDDVPFDHLPYQTAYRRLKRIGELTDGIDGKQMYGHMLRATAATHLSWAGVRPPALDVKMGWADEKTKERYAKKTAYWAMQDLKQVRGQDPDIDFSLRESPPTWEELRPDSAADRIVVERWTPKTELRSTPIYRDDEEWIQKEVSNFIDAD